MRQDCSSIANPNEELLLLSKNGNVSGVEFILKHCNGTDINAITFGGSSPLVWASTNGHVEVVQLCH